MSPLLPGIGAELVRLRREKRWRELSLPRGIDFSSNDYLGLARHPDLRAAVIDALNDDGCVGAGGSRLLRGHYGAHARLEETAATFFGVEKTLFLGSGFVANYALFSTLCERHDAVVFDASVHASVKEGLHASLGARYRAKHNDPASFEEEIIRARGKGARRVLVAVESVYSMDGDLAPLKELDDIARRHDAVLVVDEAHATGVFGPRGRGLGEELQNTHWIGLHTCGKALGVTGALITGTAEIIDYLVNKARPFIYSTATPPFLAAAVQSALELVEREPWRRETVLARADFARGEFSRLGFPVGGASQIIPILLGNEERALLVAKALQDAGFDIRAIRPPTVPAGTSRLRVSIHADHSESEILALSETLHEALGQA